MMTSIVIVLAVVNATLLVAGIAFRHPIRRALFGALVNQTGSAAPDADRTVSLFGTIRDALSKHAGGLDGVDLDSEIQDGLGQSSDQSSGHLSGQRVEEMRRSNREAGDVLFHSGGQLAELLSKYGDLYRSERNRIESYAQHVNELDGMLEKCQHDAEGSNQVLLGLVRDMLEENRVLQSKVSDCETQVSELIVRSVNSERDARTDALTKLPNRRAWEEKLEQLDQQTSIALIDVDDFKQVNDQYGHAAGDAMLNLIGTILRNLNDASAYRIGGDEFALLIPRRSNSDEKVIARRIRNKIGAAVLQFDGEKLSVSVSIGVASRSENRSLQNTMRIADEALYAAKATKHAAA